MVLEVGNNRLSSSSSQHSLHPLNIRPAPRCRGVNNISRIYLHDAFSVGNNYPDEGVWPLWPEVALGRVSPDVSISRHVTSPLTSLLINQPSLWRSPEAELSVCVREGKNSSDCWQAASREVKMEDMQHKPEECRLDDASNYTPSVDLFSL